MLQRSCTAFASGEVSEGLDLPQKYVKVTTAEDEQSLSLWSHMYMRPDADGIRHVVIVSPFDSYPDCRHEVVSCCEGHYLRGDALPLQGIAINFIDSSVDSSPYGSYPSELTPALRVTDGALDAIEGVHVQGGPQLLREVLQQRIKPVVMIDKLDRVILELDAGLEDTYLNFVRIIENANVIIATYNDEASLGDFQVFPDQGTVAFGSSHQSWAFTLTQFANLYSAKFNTDPSKLMKKMWGNHFFDVKTGKWSRTQKLGADGKPLVRGFNKFVLEPIFKMFKLIMDGRTERYTKLIDMIGVKLTKYEQDLVGKPLAGAVMPRWLPALETLVDMMVCHLPSPAAAQKYRTETLYEGPMDDPCAMAMRDCDPAGPLMVYISKYTDNSQFAFGRVFSGTIKTGQKALIMGPNHVPGEKEDLLVNNIQRTMLMMAGRTSVVDDVPCGNTVGIVGVDQYILTTLTITDHPEAHTFKRQ